MSSDSKILKCDARAAKCTKPATYECICRRCLSEPEVEEQYHACAAHRGVVDEAHKRVRGRSAAWAKM